ncbi:MAG TPA: hypothetical protein VL463_10825 [Kofleriaceae bacterium]|nr:hypothetical protein [Kofleriaceae bacterium]
MKTILMCVLVMATEVVAHAGVIRVPSDAPTVQAAVDRASDGDVIKVAPGRWCGATIDREVHLVGSWGATIQGCAAITQFGGLRVGFLLVDDRASGTSIRGFRFDGEGISTTNTDPLGLAVLGRGAHGVVVAGNWIDGTVQGITNTGGDDWLVIGNTIHGLSIFGCVDPNGRCGGGVGIVMQQRDPALDRAFGNHVLLNDVEGAIPDGLAIVGMTAVFLVGQDHPLVSVNRVAIPHNPAASASGIGVQIASDCCGEPDPLPTTLHAVITNNDGRGSEIAVQIDPEGSGGCESGNSAIVKHDLGVVIICGELQ